ncbi:MAG: alpha/beta hydrolase [Planctomycetota bacterium]
MTIHSPDVELVLLPGLDGSDALFRPFVTTTSRTATALALPKEMGRYAELVPTMRERLPRDRSYVLLGWSFSGPLTLMLAADRPPGLVGLVLCATFVRRPVTFIPPALRFAAQPGLFRFLTVASRGKALVAGYSTPELDALMQEALNSAPSRSLATRAQETLTVDVREQLAACPVPILDLRASRDLVVPRSRGRDVLALRPDAMTRVIRGPHLALATNPGDANAAIEDFIASLEREGLDHD